MEGENMQQLDKKLPEIIVFAGPIKRTNYCSDLMAAQLAEKIRSRYKKAMKWIERLIMLLPCKFS